MDYAAGFRDSNYPDLLDNFIPYKLILRTAFSFSFLYYPHVLIRRKNYIPCQRFEIFDSAKLYGTLGQCERCIFQVKNVYLPTRSSIPKSAKRYGSHY